MMDIEQAIADLNTTVATGFSSVGVRVDEVGQDVKAILSNQANTDTLPSPRHAESARFDHVSNRVTCELGTREEVLLAVQRWISPDDPRLSGKAAGDALLKVEGAVDAPVFWLCGQAGTGKSTISQSIAIWCDEGRLLAASFFCSRDDSKSSNLQNIFPTIAYQLGIRNDAFCRRVAAVLVKDPGVQETSPARQLEKLIVEPLTLVSDFPPSIVVIDALDECQDDEPTSQIVCALSHWIPRLRPLRFFLTSRPEHNIHQGFRKPEDGHGLIDNTRRLVLHKIPREVAEKDIYKYLRLKFVDIVAQYSVTGLWPSAEEVAALVRDADGLFIFAATAIKFIRTESSADPKGQLTILLQPQPVLSSTSPSSSSSSITSTTSTTRPSARLDALYLQVLHAACSRLKKAPLARLLLVLHSLVLLRDRLSSSALEDLLGVESGTVRTSLRHLHSIVVIPDLANEVLRLIHPSFHDFLINSTRCTDPRFVADPKRQHTVLAQHCLEMLNVHLRRNMCEICDPSQLNINVPGLQHQIAKHIPSHLQYASRHWASHLTEGDVNDARVLEALERFCLEHLLHWFEVMSLLGGLGHALEGLVSVQAALKQSSSHPPAKILDLLHDAERIIQYFHSGLAASASQAYYGIAPFCPRNTAFYRRYFTHASGVARLVIGGKDVWSQNIRTMEGHTSLVRSVAVSVQGDRVVSGSYDETVRVWDVRTGTQLQTLTGHTDDVNAVAFHPDGRHVFSASEDRTIIVWDTLTGGVLHTLRDDMIQGRILVIACSRDGRLLASGSKDGRIFLWAMDDLQDKDMQCILEDSTADAGADDEVLSLVFSRDAAYLVCGNDRGVCTIWDVRQRSVVCSRQDRKSKIRALVLSRDETLLVRGHRDGAVIISPFLDLSTALHTLEHPGGDIWSVEFSPTDDILASGCYDGIIYLWSPTSGQCIGTLLGHTGAVNSISFTPDGLRLCSASADCTVRIWEVAPNLGATEKPVTEFEVARPVPASLQQEQLVGSLIRSTPSAVSAVPAESLPRTSSAATEVDAGHHAQGPVRAVAFSADGQTLATGAGDGLVMLWDTRSGQRCRKFRGHEKLVSCLAFSHDGTLLVSGGFSDHRIIVRDIRTGTPTIVEGHDDSVMQVALLRDNLTLISSSLDGTLRLWRADTTTRGNESHKVVSYSQVGQLDRDMPGHDWYTLNSVFTLSDNEQFVVFSGTFRNNRKGNCTVLRSLDLVSKTVTWPWSSKDDIVALSFAQDDLAFAALTFFGRVQCFTPSTTDRSSYELAYEVSGGNNGIGTIRFSSENQWILTDSALVDTHTQTLYPSKHDSPPDTIVASPSFPRAIFLRDQWLWKTPSSGGPPRRVCWVPAEYRFGRDNLHQYRGSMAVHDDLVALGTERGRVVLIDLSQVQ